MSWAQDARSSAEFCTDVFGEAAAYLDSTLTRAIVVRASVGKARKVRDYSSHGTKLVEVVPVIVDNSEVTVRIDGTITIGLDTYSIRTVEPSIGERTICTCQRTTQHQVNRKGYRG
jgi:hypothetical protein